MKLQLEGKAVVHDEGDLTLAKLAELVNSLEMAGTPAHATVLVTHRRKETTVNGRQSEYSWDAVAKWDPKGGLGA